MTSEDIIISRLAAIEQQNQQVIELLAKLTGGETHPKEQLGISASRRMEIIIMANEVARTPKTPRKKKQSPAEVRA